MTKSPQQQSEQHSEQVGSATILASDSTSNQIANPQMNSTEAHHASDPPKSNADLSFLSSIKMSDLIAFNENNQEVDEQKSNEKFAQLIAKQKKDKEELQDLQNRLQQQTMNLNLQSIVKNPTTKQKSQQDSNAQLSGSSSSPLTTESTTKTATAGTTKPNLSADELLYQKLEKKWGLNRIEQTSEEDAMFMDQLLEKPDVQNKQGMNASNDSDSRAAMTAFNPDSASKFRADTLPVQLQHERNRRKNISEYQARYSHEIDSMMQGSPLDLKQEDGAPKIMRYMDEFREFKPQINIGERWGAILQESTVSRIQYEQQIAKGGNLISYMAKTGKLGIDLYFILFGVSAAFILPYAFYLHQKQKVNYVQKVKGINPQTVPDFYYSEYDLDEISVQKSFYNQFTDEIVEEKNKKLKMHKEIHSLTSLLYENK